MWNCVNRRCLKTCWAGLVLLAACLPAQAQQYRLHLDVLGETHSPPSLHRYQDDLVASLRSGGLTGTEAVQSFPPYVGFRVYAGRERSFNSPHHMGLLVQIGSTGARTAYRDPEGSIYIDDRVAYRAFGLMAEHTLGANPNYEDRTRIPFLYATPLLEWTRVAHEERVSVGTTQARRATFNAIQPGLEFGGGVRFMRGANYGRLALGVYWRVPAALKGGDVTEQIGITKGGLRVSADVEEARSDGFGLRLSVGIGLTR